MDSSTATSWAQGATPPFLFPPCPHLIPHKAQSRPTGPSTLSQYSSTILFMSQHLHQNLEFQQCLIESLLLILRKM